MKSIQIQSVNQDTINQDLFGIKYKITNQGVDILTFTPSLITSDDYFVRNRYEKYRDESLKQFQVDLSLPFFLPLRKGLRGLYEQCIFYLPKELENDEHIDFIWSFTKRSNWRETALDMYQSYLNGDDNPSDIAIFRKVSDKMYILLQKITPTLSVREYSQDVEDKIIDEGYTFQCVIETNSKRPDDLINTLQDIFLQYDYQNSLIINTIDNKYPYTLYPSNQILSKGEISSLFCRKEIEIQVEDIPNVPIKESVNKESSQVGEVGWKDKISLLPQIEKEDVEIDDTIISRLADALKRTGVIKQARLYNESIEYGSRLTVIQSDIPKGKNFSDVQKKTKDVQVALGVHYLSIEQGDEAGTVKYSIPHNSHQIVSLRELISSEDFHEYSKNNELSFIAGVDEVNNPIYLSLKELRHILIVGSQGSGKSVFLNQLCTTLLLTHSPEEVNFIMIDPKQVELNQYERFPHVQEVITNMSKALKAFNGLIAEMENRYTLFKENKVKNINNYKLKTNSSLPYIVAVIEEWADLFSVGGKDVETVVQRLGQKARAAGIFLVIVTQRPSAKILSGDIKANIPNKFSFNLGSNINYRTVFDSGIPCNLLGKGDGIFQIENYPKDFQRFQSPIIGINDVKVEEMYEELCKTYSIPNEKYTLPESKESDSLMDRLKHLIADTGETRLTILREQLGVKTLTLSNLMNELVSEGWLIKHKNRSKGYELVADATELEKWKTNEGGLDNRF